MSPPHRPHRPLSPVIIGPRCNRLVTCDSSPSHARSESVIAVNPLDPYNMVGASKRFNDLLTYHFTLSTSVTFDGGQSWIEGAKLKLLDDWGAISDPAFAWDNKGNVYLVALALSKYEGYEINISSVGIAIYKSSDSGRTWSSPELIHKSKGDDKQWAAGDGDPGSKYYGNVYAAWDDDVDPDSPTSPTRLAFARSTDGGSTWKGIKIDGVDKPPGTPLKGILDSYSPELSIASDGTIYIVWSGSDKIDIRFIKSTDGGDSFSEPKVAAKDITTLIVFPMGKETTGGGVAYPSSDEWHHFPGARFRIITFPTGCTGKDKNVIFAWADARERIDDKPISRIYYRRSINGGDTWEGPASGQPLLTGDTMPEADQHDFHPQIVSTPNGEIGCAFYEFGPKRGYGEEDVGPSDLSPEWPQGLIDVILAVSVDNGKTFSEKVTVTDRPWDPATGAPLVHGSKYSTFIGDYFGLDASRLGFFPLWTDTRTGLQQLFTSRISVRPTDIYIRDSGSDIGDIPSPGYHWEYVDLIVRHEPDGDIAGNFHNQDLLPGVNKEYYIYGRVTNRGAHSARNVQLSVTVGNYPSLIGLPGTEFRYPQDWYKGDWNTAALKSNHLYLGPSKPVNIAVGSTKIVGPVAWNVTEKTSWHPCLLAEVLADNDDSAGGLFGCEISAAYRPTRRKNIGTSYTCFSGSYFWGNNNVCQRNVSYATVKSQSASIIEYSFVVGNIWSNSEFIEVIVEKGNDLYQTPIVLQMEQIKQLSSLAETSKSPSHYRADLVFIDQCRAMVRVDSHDIGEINAAPGTVWQSKFHPPQTTPLLETSYGALKEGKGWKLIQIRSAIGFPVFAGEMRKITLAFRTPATLKAGERTFIRIFQRNDEEVITGSVFLELKVE